MRSWEEPDIWPTALLESASKSPLSFQVTFAIAHIRLEKHKQIKTLHFCREKVFSYNLKCINEKWQKNIFQIQFLVHILYMYAISSLTPLLFQRANSIIQNPASDPSFQRLLVDGSVDLGGDHALLTASGQDSHLGIGIINIHIRLHINLCPPNGD